MAGRIKKKKEVNAEIPSSSMSDIAFLLIVFFMVTTAFSTQKGIDFQLPKDKPETQNEETHAVLIEILPSGRLMLDNNPANLSDIYPYLTPKLANNPNKFVIIKTADEAQYGDMVDVLDELKQANVKNIALPTKQEIASWGEY